MFLISHFRRVLRVVFLLLCDSPASEFYVSTFRNTAFRNVDTKFRRRGITQNKYISMCFILHKMLHIIILLSVRHFLYTTHSICTSCNSEGRKKLPDDGRLLPKRVGASI
jgi:hypothetical protein